MALQQTIEEKDQKEVKGHHTVKSQQQDDVEPSQADDSQIHDEVEMMLSKKQLEMNKENECA